MLKTKMHKTVTSGLAISFAMSLLISSGCAMGGENKKNAAGEPAATSISSEKSIAKETDQERNKKNLQRLYDELFNTGKVENADKLVTVDRPDHEVGLPPPFTKGREGLKSAVGWLYSVFADFHVTTEFMVAEGDKVSSVVIIEGTQKGPLNGMAGTGKKMHMEMIDVCRFNKDGMIAEHWGTINNMEMLKELGLLPPPPSAK